MNKSGFFKEESNFCQMSLEELLDFPAKLQHRLKSEMADTDARLITANADSDHGLAHMRSVWGQGAGAWIQAVLTSDELTFNACEFCLVTCLRLGLPLPFHDWVQ